MMMMRANNPTQTPPPPGPPPAAAAAADAVSLTISPPSTAHDLKSQFPNEGIESSDLRLLPGCKVHH